MVLAVAAAALLVLVVLPLASLVWSSVTDEGGLTLANFRAALSQRLYVQALWNSLILGAWTAVLSVAIGLPMAWAVGRTNVPAKKFIHLTAVVAYVTPPYLTAIAFVYLFSPNAGLLNRFAREALAAPALTFNVFSMSGLVLVTVLHTFPFVYLLAASALESVDASMEESARSLVVEPSILLLDEPLSNLDAKLRERMRWELKDLQRRIGITFVYVTHDQSEAMALSDRIAVMHQGRLQQCGPPREVYARPANRTVADFMGLVNLLPGRVARDGSAVTLGGAYTLGVALPPGAREGQAVQIAIRPENIRLAQFSDSAGAPPPDAVPAKVVEVTFLGNLTDCHVTLDDGTRVRVQAEPGAIFDVGQRVLVRLDGRACTVFHD